MNADKGVVLEEKGSVKLMRELLRKSRGFDAEELASIDVAARRAGGSIVAVADVVDDDWCGTGKIHFPLPPPKGVGEFLQHLIERDIIFDIWRYGQPAPIDGLAIEFRKDALVQSGKFRR